VCSVHECFCYNSAVPLRRSGYGIHFLKGQGQRFFAKNVLAGLHCLDRPLGVQMVGQRVIYHIDLRAG